MAPKIFLTGATGYIGGSVFETLYTAHPEWSYTVLLRTAPASFAERYPNANIIRGDYDNFDAPSTAAAISDADVVVHTGNSDHAPSLRALLRGLKKQPTNPPQHGKRKTKYLIHLSGTGILSDYQSDTVPQGALNPRVYSDTSLADNTTIFLPAEGGSDAASWKEPLHGETERIVYEAWKREEEEEEEKKEKPASTAAPRVRTAVVRPPDIYGRGLGLGRTTSALVPMFVGEILGERGVGAAFFVGGGRNSRGWVHLEDLMALYLALVEKAVEDGDSDGDGPARRWGREGYYHASTQEVSQLEVAQAVGRILYEKGLIKEKEPKQVPLERVDGMLGVFGIPLIARYLFASNARSTATRAKEVLGWEPRAPSLWDVLEQDVVDGLKSLGSR